MASSHFANAHHFNIEHLTTVHPTSSNYLEKGFQLLYDNIAIEAAHNSAERHDAPTCHEDTRRAVQEEIHSWITDGDEDDEPKMILSLMGPAGAGKTAIAGSIADACDELGLLAGSFFFASFAPSEARRSKRCLVATLVYHLISSLDDQHPLRHAVIMAVKRDPSIFWKKLKDQLRLLLIKPLANTRHLFDVSTLPKVFIIDGLDEVEAVNSRQHGRDAHEVRLENEADQEEILSALLYAARSSAFPFHIIVGSRPERVITTFFSGSAAAGVTKKIFLDEKYDPDSDIRLYLHAKFAEIRRRYKLPSSWPLEEEVDNLVDTSSGQFIYAATVIRFLQSGKQPDPQQALRSLPPSQHMEASALAPLDALYRCVLRSSPDTPLALRWLFVIDQFAGIPAAFLNQFLQDHIGQAAFLLENVTSLLWMPLVEDQSDIYRFYHKSFLDFLNNETRCGEEVAQAFRAGASFRFARAISILKDESPVVPLPKAQQEDFLDHFVSNAFWMPHSRSANLEPWVQEALVNCDVVGWVHRALVTNHFWLPSKGPITTISGWFHSFHISCPIDRCIPACTHWRSNILRACKEVGWDLPNVIALFRESLLPIRYPFICRYFPSETRPAHLGNIQLPTITTRYCLDEEYQAMLDLVVAMCSRLPPGWESQLELEHATDRYADYGGLAAVVEKIRQELGIDAPDIFAPEGNRFLATHPDP